MSLVLYALVNAIDALVEQTPAGAIKPELMQSVLEISTNPCADPGEANLALRALAEHYDAGSRLADYPCEMLDENQWLAARHGLEGELVDLPERRRVPSRGLARRLYDRLKEHAQELGGADALEGVLDLIEHGNGADRQRKVYEANRDFSELLRDIVQASAP